MNDGSGFLLYEREKGKEGEKFHDNLAVKGRELSLESDGEGKKLDDLLAKKKGKRVTWVKKRTNARRVSQEKKTTKTTKGKGISHFYTLFGGGGTRKRQFFPLESPQA